MRNLGEDRKNDATGGETHLRGACKPPSQSSPNVELHAYQNGTNARRRTRPDVSAP